MFIRHLTIKLAFISVFVLTALTCRSQELFLKGSAIAVPIDFPLGLYSGTIGTELKCKRIGLEYIANTYSNTGERSSSRSATYQLSIKYYVSDRVDSLLHMKIYVAPFVQYKTFKEYDEMEFGNPLKPFNEAGKGMSFGFLVGGTKELTSYFGLEPAFYFYYLTLSRDHSRQFYNSFNINGLHLGLRFFVYLKCGK